MKIGLQIVTLLHDITQLGYKVHFVGDFEGMMRLDFTSETMRTFYHHEHLGVPDGEKLILEKAIIKCLSNFYEKYKEVNENN